jgi:hypothetical protein
LRWLGRLWRTAIDWLDGLAGTHPIVYYGMLVVATVLLGLLLVHVGYVVWRIVRPSAQTGAVVGGAGPAQVLDARAHLARAAELAAAGRYAEALGHRFLAVVLELERAERLRFHASKTPAEYVGEARLGDAARATFASLVVQLYRHLFGAVPCGEPEYRNFGAMAEDVTRYAAVV